MTAGQELISDATHSDSAASSTPTLGLTRRAAGWRHLLATGVGRREQLAWAIPALLAGVYVIVLLTNFTSVITSINMYGDGVVAPVLAKLFGQSPAGSQVVLGHHAYYEEWLFLRATAGLSFYRRLWEIAPVLWTLGGIAMLAWSARRALGGFAAMITASALICLGTLGRYSFFTFDWHGLTVIHTILVGCSLVWLAPRAGRISWGAVATLGVLLGLLSALPASGDVLFVFWALVPMAIAALVISSKSSGRARWTPLAFAAITVAVTLVFGAVLAHVMRSNGVTATPPAYSFVGSGTIAIHNVEVLFEGFMALGGGYFFGTTVNLLGVLVFASGILVLVAIFVGLLELRRLAAQTRTVPARTPATAGGSSLAYVSFWGSSLLVAAAVFVITSVPKVTAGSSRYALAGYVAIMALVPLIARRGPRLRLLLAAGASVFAISSIVQLAHQPFAPFGRYPTPTVADRVLQFARAHDVSYGYAGYWDAPDLTWLTKFKLKIYPVQRRCGPRGICAMSAAYINTWYRPRPGTHSLLIADSAFAPVRWIEPRLGRPSAVMYLGTLTIAVYPYDIASTFSGGVAGG